MDNIKGNQAVTRQVSETPPLTTPEVRKGSVGEEAGRETHRQQNMDIPNRIAIPRVILYVVYYQILSV